MVGVVVHLEDRWNYTQSDRDMDVMQMYEESAKALGADLFVVIDKTTDGMIHRFPADIKYASYGSLSEALKAYPAATKLYFEHVDAIPARIQYVALHDLVHPEGDVLYLFGGDEAGLGDLGELVLGEGDAVVSIDVTTYIFWAIVAMTVALYDRHTKAR